VRLRFDDPRFEFTQDRRHKLQLELGCTVSEAEIAKELRLSLRELHNLLNEIRGLEIGSLQCESADDGQETGLAQNIAGPPDRDPLTLCLAGEQKQRLEKAIARLPEREQQVLMLYYQQELTMREVGELMGVGESRVSQIHTLAVEHLRSAM
jgi:RNA polymerase sigma factor for flagellar operon FliA